MFVRIQRTLLRKGEMVNVLLWAGEWWVIIPVRCEPLRQLAETLLCHFEDHTCLYLQILQPRRSGDTSRCDPRSDNSSWLQTSVTKSGRRGNQSRSSLCEERCSADHPLCTCKGYWQQSVSQHSSRLPTGAGEQAGSRRFWRASERYSIEKIHEWRGRGGQNSCLRSLPWWPPSLQDKLLDWFSFFHFLDVWGPLATRDFSHLILCTVRVLCHPFPHRFTNGLEESRWSDLLNVFFLQNVHLEETH